MMFDYSNILASRGSNQWVTLLVFIIIVTVNAISSIIKSNKNKNAKKITKSKGKYKPMKEWSNKPVPAGHRKSAAAEIAPANLQHTQTISASSATAAEIHKPADDSIKSVKDIKAQYNPPNTSYNKSKHRDMLVNKYRQIEKQQKLLELEKRKLLVEKKKFAELVKQRNLISGSFNDTFGSSASFIDILTEPDNLQDIVIACEVLSAPVSLHSFDTRAF